MVRFAPIGLSRFLPVTRRGFLGVGVTLAIVVAAAFGVGVLSAPRAAYFSDPLTGPTSSRLSIPAGKYAHTPQGLRREQSDDRLDRPIVKTVSGAYLTVPHFTAAVTVDVAPGDIAFIGFGQAVNDRTYFSEPGHCFAFRIHHLAETRIDIAASFAGRDLHFLNIRRVGVYVPGVTNRFRIVRDGDYVTLSIPSLNVSRTFSISQYNAQLGLTNENTHLFFTNIGTGTVFSNFQVSRDATEPEAR